MLTLLLLLFSFTVSAQSAANGKAVIIPETGPKGPYEQTALKFAKPAATQGSSGAVSKPNTDWDFARIPVALGGVILLIFVLRWAGKAIAGKSSSKNGGRGVQVLSRAVVSPRQQMLVVQFGRKLVLVGNSGTDMTPLCQLDDPDEVAEVLAQIAADKRGVAGSFKSVFSGAEKPYVEGATVRQDESHHDEESPDAAPTAEPVSGDDINGLMTRIRRMSEKFQES